MDKEVHRQLVMKLSLPLSLFGELHRFCYVLCRLAERSGYRNCCAKKRLTGQSGAERKDARGASDVLSCDASQRMLFFSTYPGNLIVLMKLHEVISQCVYVPFVTQFTSPKVRASRSDDRVFRPVRPELQV